MIRPAPSYPIFFFFTILAVLGIFLGFWQHQRSLEKTALLRQVQGADLTPIALSSLAALEHIPWFSVVHVRGAYREQPKILIDHVWQKKQLGYGLWVPFCDGSACVWANVGFVKRGYPHRLDVVFPSLAKGDITLEAQYYRPRPAFVLEHTIEPLSAGVFLLQSLDMKHVRKLAPDVLPFTLRALNDQQKIIQAKDWVRVPPWRHQAYAWQWWFLSLLCATFAFIFSYFFRKPSCS